MIDVGDNIRKLCSFYANEWHLSVMLLPYLNSQINQDVKITTILKDETEENINTLVKKLNLKNANKILEINWKKNNINKYETIEKELNKICNNNNVLIIINGDERYIESANKILERYLSKNNMKNKKIKIKIIDCYDISKLEKDMDNIIYKYDAVLNTSGEKNVVDF